MKLNYVLTACNNNEFYYSLIPVWISAWKKFYSHIKPIVIVISDKDDKLEHYEDNIIYFKPVENISTVFTSQFIRILYPCLINSNEGILITDIDDIPLNSSYFCDNIKNIFRNKFIYYRSWKINETPSRRGQYCIMYNVANQKCWQEIMKIYSLEDVKETLIRIYNSINYKGSHGGSGWFTDQEYLYKAINNWENKEKNFVQLLDHKSHFNRLNPENSNDTDFDILLEKINNGEYSDYHIWRPYNRFIDFNNFLINKLRLSNILII